MNRKKVSYICPTYRKSGETSVSRLFGLVSLFEQIKKQKTEHSVNLCIVDSSEQPHPFFNNITRNLGDFIYLHIPDRLELSQEHINKYPFACSFIPTEKDYNSGRWGDLVKQASAWANFIPWRDGSPIVNPIDKSLYGPRPPVGSKRNAAIAALSETYGEPDLIAFADDDDYRSPYYTNQIVTGIGDYDFARMSSYITADIMQKETTNKWGIYQVYFAEDANGNFLPRKEDRDLILLSNDASRQQRKIGEKFNKLLCLAFNPLSFEGALHVYKYSHWKRSVEAFGGLLPVNHVEDIVYHTKSKQHFGADFSSKNIVPDELSFLRTTDGTNVSYVEWTHLATEENIPEWAKRSITPLSQCLESALSIDTIHQAFVDMANNYNKTGEISWQIAVPHPRMMKP